MAEPSALPLMPTDLSDWYYGEIQKLGLEKTDCPAIFWEGAPIRRRRYTPMANGKSREQLEEVLSELKTQMGIEQADC